MAKSGEVKFITGVVIATDENGSKRILQIGDNVSAAELIETSEIGSISIEFANGAVFDLGRNASSSYAIESENPLFEKVDKVVTAAETEALEQSLLSDDETFDPTNPETGLEAPAAGPVAEFEDDGSTIVQNEYAEPRRTPDNGFETEPINVQFPEPTPLELIQNPIAESARSSSFVEPPSVPPVFPAVPEVEIFSVAAFDNEVFASILPVQIRQRVGFRTDPADGDTVTKIVISGFPEDGNDVNSPDWRIQSKVTPNSTVNFKLSFEGYTPTPSGWQVTLDVKFAQPGEEIDFLLNITPARIVTQSEIPLQIATTYTDGTNSFTSSSDVVLDIV